MNLPQIRPLTILKFYKKVKQSIQTINSEYYQTSDKGPVGSLDQPPHSQHDKVEPNLKKIPHRNGIWGLEANSM